MSILVVVVAHVYSCNFPLGALLNYRSTNVRTAVEGCSSLHDIIPEGCNFRAAST